MIDHSIIYALPIAFLAGFVDAIAGGGGLIQIPGLMFLFPSVPVVTLLGTNKLASCCGSFMASWHYARTMKIDLKAMMPTLVAAFLLSAFGAKTATLIDNQILKPIVFFMLISIGLYAFFNKKLGMTQTKNQDVRSFKMQVYTILTGITMGFYDGFFGPGTGSILIFIFVGWLKFDFLYASAFSKLTNLASNLAAMIYFASSGHILYDIALPMAAFNVLGNLLGAKLAIKKGSRLVRGVFLVVIVAILFHQVIK